MYNQAKIGTFKPKLVHTVCTFRPKFAHTVCTIKAFLNFLGYFGLWGEIIILGTVWLPLWLGGGSARCRFAWDLFIFGQWLISLFLCRNWAKRLSKSLCDGKFLQNTFILWQTVLVLFSFSVSVSLFRFCFSLKQIFVFAFLWILVWRRETCHLIEQLSNLLQLPCQLLPHFHFLLLSLSYLLSALVLALLPLCGSGRFSTSPFVPAVGFLLTILSIFSFILFNFFSLFSFFFFLILLSFFIIICLTCFFVVLLSISCDTCCVNFHCIVTFPFILILYCTYMYFDILGWRLKICYFASSLNLLWCSICILQ